MIPSAATGVDERAGRGATWNPVPEEFAVIVGLGIDVIEIERIAQSIARHGDALLHRLLSERERRFASVRRNSGLAAHVAGRFAAKEAALKALGIGLAAGLRWHDVEIVATALHEPPRLVLHGPAADRMAHLGATKAHVSITHGTVTAAAVAILEA